MDWQPIETAPNEISVLGCNKDGERYITFKHKKSWYIEQDGMSPPWSPTHWMPLPPPPTK